MKQGLLSGGCCVSTYFKLEMKVGVNETAQSLHKCCRKEWTYQADLRESASDVSIVYLVSCLLLALWTSTLSQLTHRAAQGRLWRDLPVLR